MGKEQGQFDYAPEQVKSEWESLFGEIEEAGKGMAREDWTHFTPQFLDTLSPSIDIAQITADIEAGQKIARAEKIGQEEATVIVPTKLPITVFAIGDIHTGSIFTNEALWQAHRKRILETPGAYVVFLHNLVDNANPSQFPDSMLANRMHPTRQFAYMQAQIKELDEAGKVLAAIEGDCHEGWSWKKAGISASSLLYGYKGRKFPVLENGGVLRLHVGDEDYVGMLFHKQGPFKSNFNPEHSLRTNRRFGNVLTDFVLGAHYHKSVATNDWEGYKQATQKVAFIQAGTYKGYWPKGSEGPVLNDKFSVDGWGTSGEPPGNSMILYPFQHDLEATLGFDTSIEKHEAVRIALFLETLGKKEELLTLMGKVA